jgi:ribonuclease J
VARREGPAGYQFVDGVLDDISVGVLRDRKSLAAEGVVVVIVTVDAASGDLVTGPEIVTRGWVHEAEAADLLDEARAEVRAAIARAAADGATDPEAVRRHARRALGRFINARTRRRPAIIPVVLEV